MSLLCSRSATSLSGGLYPQTRQFWHAHLKTAAILATGEGRGEKGRKLLTSIQSLC